VTPPSHSFRRHVRSPGVWPHVFWLEPPGTSFVFWFHGFNPEFLFLLRCARDLGDRFFLNPHRTLASSSAALPFLQSNPPRRDQATSDGFFFFWNRAVVFRPKSDPFFLVRAFQAPRFETAPVHCRPFKFFRCLLQYHGHPRGRP